MFVFAPHLPCALLIAALLWVTPAAPGFLQCQPQELPGLVINVSVAVAKGARFTDPIRAASVEECVSACCSQLSHAGDRACNLAVFDSRRGITLQNCYLFLCPGPEACPMLPTRGVMSYSLWTENSSPEIHDGDPAEEHSPKTPKSKDNGKKLSSSGKKTSSANHLVVPAAPVSEEEFDLQVSEEKFGQQDSAKRKLPPVVIPKSKTGEEKVSSKDTANTPAQITSELLHLAENIDRQLEKIEHKSEEAENFDDSIEDLPISHKVDKVPVPNSRHNEPKKLPPKELEEKDSKETKISKVIEKRPSLEVHFPRPESTRTTTFRTSPKVTTAAPQTALRTKPNLVLSSSTSRGNKAAKKGANLDTKSGKVPPSRHSDPSATTVRSMQGSLSITTTEVPRTSQHTKPPQTEAPDNPLRVSKLAQFTPKDEVHSFTSEEVKELGSPEALPANPNAPKNLDAQEAVSGSGDRSGLVAALVFGVVFLAVVIGLVSHKVTEARRRHRYTKLDYLINGMYVDT